MSSSLIPVSGTGAKGPACFVVNTRGARIMLDLGHGPQPGVYPDVSRVDSVDALLLSHSHGDHAGGLTLRSRIGNPRVYASTIVAGLVGGDVEGSLPLSGTADICGIRVTVGRNGHAPGGVWIHLDVDDGLLYTGDYSVESSVYAYDPPPPAKTVILDASYGAYDEPIDSCRRQLERLAEAGPVLLPVPAAGRAGDMALHLAQSGRLPHLDDHVRATIASLATDYRDCVKPEATDALAAIARDAPPIRATESGAGVMLGSVASTAGASANALLERWRDAPGPAIAFTGFVAPGTLADSLVRSGRATFTRWNVHPRLADNADLVKHAGARVVLPAFGHAGNHDAWKAAFAPAEVVYDGPVLL